MKIARYDSLSTDDRSDGNRHDSSGDDGRRLARFQAGDPPLGHPHERPPNEPEALLTFFRGAGRRGRSGTKNVRRLQQYPAGVAAADRIYGLLDREPASASRSGRPLRRHCRDLVFENVGFAYQSGNPVIREIKLRIPFGETIAIVGPNGCGKSTLANLIPRFADPTRA